MDQKILENIPKETIDKFNSIFSTFFIDTPGVTEILLKEGSKVCYKHNWELKITDLDWEIKDNDLFLYQYYNIIEKTKQDKEMLGKIEYSLNNKWYYNYSFSFQGYNFRINWSMCQGRHVMNIRSIKNDILRPKEIWIPKAILENIKDFGNWWLVVVSAPPGEWKSTTIASLIQEISHFKTLNIITLEDPIEYIYKDSQSFILQREKGFDFDEYSSGIESAMRQLPDIVVVQEMTTPEIIRDVMLLVEKWILVITTLHTPDVIWIFESILSSFDDSRRKEFLNKLVNNFKIFISQRLIKSKDSDRLIASFEYVTNTNEVRGYIAKDKIHNLSQVMDKEGHMLFSKDLAQRVSVGEINIEGALSQCPFRQVNRLKEELGIV